LAHADETRRRFVSRNVTTGQIVMFGLSGGLIPCSAAIAVLVLCLQLHQAWLGVALVLCFNIGLTITLTTRLASRQGGALDQGRHHDLFRSIAITPLE
jgi:nickel/cobalt exporter